MEILSKNKDILDYFNTAISNKDNNLELETIFGSNPNSSDNPINKIIFLRLLNKLKSNSDPISVSINLDIRIKQGNGVSNSRCSITDIDSIKKYCISNSLENIPLSSIKIIQKENYTDETIKNSRIINQEYNYRINLKSENDLDYDEAHIKRYNNEINTKLKHFRYKKRYSFITNDKLFRIDLSAIKSTQYIKKIGYKYAKTFNEANILNNQEEYELEIEYIGSTDTKENGVYLINDYYNKILSDVDEPFSLSGTTSDPLSLGFVLHEPSVDTSELSLMPDIISDLPKLPQELQDKILGKYIKIKDTFTKLKETYNLKELNRDDNLKIIDYNSDYKKVGKHVKLNISSTNETIWVPLIEIYSHHFDIDDVLLEIFNVEQFGGGKSDDDKKLIFNTDKIDLLSEKCVELLNDHIVYLSEIIQDNKLILSKSQKNTILNRYGLLTNQKKIYNVFIAPQPVTLNYENLLLSSDINIFKGYAVTEKADGIRCVLFITESTGYLITSKMEIIPTGLKFPDISGEWLLDGEYITKNKIGEDLDINLYMIFDIYHNGNSKGTKSIHMFKWIDSDDKPSRLNELNRFRELIENQIRSDKNYIRIGIKDYEYGSSKLSDPSKDPKKFEAECKLIFQKCKKVLDKTNSFEYYIDGLILMPTYLGVKGDKLNPSPSYIGGTWEYNFKWKPPEENTIDFKVSTEKISPDSKQDKIYPVKDEHGIIHKYKKLNIINGYNEEDDLSLNFWMKILTGDKPSKEKTKIFDPPNIKEKVNVTNILLQDNKMLCLKGSDEIKDGDIVEMRYNPDALNDMIWEPLRIRSDKIKPNFKTIADNVWKTITTPITNDLITGIEPYNEKKLKKKVKLTVDTGYYISNNRSLETSILTKLHNYIKTSLINGICSIFKKHIQYMDLSCGRGGDVDRYVNPENNIKFVLGLDIEDINEASRRYFYKQSNNKGVFLQYDTSKNIKLKEQDNINKHSKIMIDILYGLTKQVPSKYKNVAKEYFKLAKNKFQVVSSQFTLHYYLENEETFNGFLTNVDENIDKGGYFIATFYNGNKLFELLKDKEGVDYINKSGDKVYEIKKKYELDNFNYDIDDISNMFGNTIGVYMDSIGQEFDEYLVNMDFLIDSFKKRGMELVTPKSKLNIFNESNFDIEGLGSFEKIIGNLNTMSKKDQLLKTNYKGAINIIKDDKLKLLSGLNVYVIFQKK
jgi:hypothetical protein